MRKVILAILSLGLLLPGMVMSVGLGKIELNSVLNEPLKAEVKLLSLKRTHVEEIRVGLASPEAFKRVGLERSFVLTKLIFSVEKNAGGTPIVHITTREPVTDPYLNFLMYVSWSSGELFRNYTVLLDPPNYSYTSAQAIQAPQTVEIKETVETKVEQPAHRVLVKTAKKPVPKIVRKPVQIAKTHSATETAYGPTKPTDTLFIIG